MCATWLGSCMALTLDPRQNAGLGRSDRRLLIAETIRRHLEGLRSGRRDDHVQVPLASTRIDAELVGVLPASLADADHEVDVVAVAEPPRNPTQSVKLEATVVSHSCSLSTEGEPACVEADCVVADTSMVRKSR